MAAIIGMNLATIVTVASVVTVPGTAKGSWVGARLAAGAAATLTVYNNTTAVGSRVTRLQTAAAGSDETRMLIRMDGVVKVQLSTTASSTIGFIYVG